MKTRDAMEKFGLVVLERTRKLAAMPARFTLCRAEGRSFEILNDFRTHVGSEIFMRNFAAFVGREEKKYANAEDLFRDGMAYACAKRRDAYEKRNAHLVDGQRKEEEEIPESITLGEWN